MELTAQALEDYDTWKAQAKFADTDPDTYLRELRDAKVLQNWYNVVRTIAAETTEDDRGPIFLALTEGIDDIV